MDIIDLTLRKCTIVSGPCLTGKTTLIKNILAQYHVRDECKDLRYILVYSWLNQNFAKDYYDIAREFWVTMNDTAMHDLIFHVKNDPNVVLILDDINYEKMEKILNSLDGFKCTVIIASIWAPDFNINEKFNIILMHRKYMKGLRVLLHFFGIDADDYKGEYQPYLAIIISKKGGSFPFIQSYKGNKNYDFIMKNNVKMVNSLKLLAFQALKPSEVNEVAQTCPDVWDYIKSKFRSQGIVWRTFGTPFRLQ